MEKADNTQATLLPIITGLSRISPAIVGLAVLDVTTTKVASEILGARFAELGVIASFFIRSFPGTWPFYAYGSEITVFIATSIVFALLWRDTSVRFGSKRIPVSYLPAFALLALVVNNSLVIFFQLG